MRILLIGEYSRLHNSLKEGLQKLGHDVTLVGTYDGFKDLPVDISYDARFFTKPWLNVFVKLIDKLFSINLISVEYGFRFSKILPQLKGYDIVQLINENSIKAPPKTEIKLLGKLLKQNDSVFLLSCGTDYVSVKYADDKKFKYSILTPYHNSPNLLKRYKFILQYLEQPYYKLHKFLYKNVKGVIASSMDYHLPLKNHSEYLGMIPNPVNVDQIDYNPLQVNDKIVIFHGINRSNYIKKGNQFFVDALKIIERNFSDKVEIITSESLPYEEYIKAYNKCHILLDQVYAYDQGYNALEAMAKGKVVFTGGETEWREYFSVENDTIVINALPDAKKIADKLEWLILNSKKIIEISKNARAFIEGEHHYRNIAEQYLNVWKNHK